jgi:hypothetical protein
MPRCPLICLFLCALLNPPFAHAEDDLGADTAPEEAEEAAIVDQTPPSDEAAPGDEAAQAEPIEDKEPLVEDPQSDPTALQAALEAPVVRLYSRGRVGAGLLIGDGTLAVTLLQLVRVGGPVVVLAADGSTTQAGITAFDESSGLALLRLDEPLGSPGPEGSRPTMRSAVPGEPAAWRGHGGSPGLASYDVGLRALTQFSAVPTRVLAVPPVDLEPDDLDDLLIDREPGTGDRGAPLYGADGALLGIVDQPVEGGAGRTRVISARRVAELLDQPRLEQRYRKRSHLQFWSGVGVAAHNQPSHLAGTATVGFRIAILDHLRIEPWFETLVGFRAAFSEEDDEGVLVADRPTDLWWSLEAGLSFGYRIPVANDTSRDYVTPNIGVRLGWNKFQHRVESLASDCTDGPCRYVVRRTLDQVKQLRPGIDLGFDVRHGRVRIGYRFFLDPAAIQAHSMHRVFVTFDGLPLPIAIGDTH